MFSTYLVKCLPSVGAGWVGRHMFFDCRFALKERIMFLVACLSLWKFRPNVKTTNVMYAV